MAANRSQNLSGNDDENEAAIDTWPEYKAADWIIRYPLFAIILLGTVGNFLSIAVLSRLHMRNNSINIYLIILSVSDTLVLYLSGFKTWLRVVTGFELLHVSNAGCKIVIFLFMFASHVSAWTIVLVTVDRFIAVWFPLRAAILCSTRRSRVTSIAMLVVMATLTVHLLWTNQLFELSPGHVQCAPLPSNAFMNGAYNYIRLACYTVVPFVCVLVMNVAIILCIVHYSRRSLGADAGSRAVRGGGGGGGDSAQPYNKHQVTVMLLVVSFSWLLLTLPFAIISLVDFTYPDSRSRAVTFLLKTLSFLLMYLNHSVNFILYCIAGRKFRTEFVAMFRDLRRSRAPSAYSLTEKTTGRGTTRFRQSAPFLGYSQGKQTQV